MIYICTIIIYKLKLKKKMLLIAEIILTIFAWRNGWKWLALLPIGIGFTLGLVVGFVIGASGGSTENAGWVVILDIIVTIVLIVMCSKKPKSAGDSQILLKD